MNYSDAPRLLAEIADIAGENAARLLSARKGGTVVYIPAYVEDGHWLAELLGIDAARAIGRHLSVEMSTGRRTGAHVLIPMHADRIGGARWGAALSSGKSANEIATMLGVHVRTVHRRRRKARFGRA